LALRPKDAGDQGRDEGLRAGKRLVAYVVPNDEQEPTVSELRRFLREKLPDYMVPSAFVTLEALPLTPSGKVNRRALPVPDRVRPELEGVYVAPRTPTEEVLTGIWAQVLGVEQVGVHDDFFELGGHSLLATRVVSQMRQAFQVELPVRALFEAPTVAGLAERVEVARRTEQGPSAPPIVPVERDQVSPDELSDEAVYVMLGKMLARKGANQ